ncbi:phosphocholine cytidylyltransferase family protein [Sandaracinobacteroides hominis]|uniref:phosphocholine cytidylyltransferase family protein n=1 Tax=Sandaracinobacteroides hominis TaxID=2780086 RepID=UPI0018F62914|nr:NTP transferase domain-containing protein [Sandaracinobacteroides hominis]
MTRLPTATNAIILAAGAGSRLADVEAVKPLADIGGKPLILHSIESLMTAGAASVTIVVGNRAEDIRAALRQAPLPLEFVDNPDWQAAPNGVSVLAARRSVRPGTLLTMADHLLSPELVGRLVMGAAHALALGVDRRLGHPWVDEADVTRVLTDGGEIRAIGKGLCVYDAYDTGLFRIGPELVEALAGLAAPGLSDGVRLLAANGLAGCVDIGDAPWLDVDDARALDIARKEWRLA